MDLIKLEIIGVSYTQAQTGAYALILKESDGNRKLPIVIGGYEAEAITVGLENDIVPPRPSTHDLFINLMERFEISIKQVIIHKLVDGVFFSSLICDRNDIEEIIDARTSDAIALAIRFNAPVFTYENIMSKASYSDDIRVSKSEQEDKNWIKNFIDEKDSKNKEVQNLTKLSTKDLHAMLNKLVKAESYEAAAKIRDELSRRK
ncbi:bifunctional nuclease family protein [Flavobacteriaceae bacterium]|jgi:bifunctional DNase/RNase|nr:bifunctional nuclease family protein [Flavobacteriaceae bacterium]MDB4620813.1 bifunctional nuclease family protein [Flavobacteriaceae bacterium]MDB4643352.1 bifunctional nuclease family protein [Flavobacteriaceae bacterium]MDB4751064.1 bifunctional nuclease family protein [Flavobacteriaceae bacterium]MDC0960603.1 bifunctional nuclease family protein [Flavobacteriaceae bacterium]